MSYGWVAKKSEQVTPSTSPWSPPPARLQWLSPPRTTTTQPSPTPPLSQGSAVMRGPRSSAVASQMLTLTDWGELDYLVIDMPPGGCCCVP
jgi:hypothetical protein